MSSGRRSPITHGSALVALSRLALAPLISSRRKYSLPRLDTPPNGFLPPVEFCGGTRPSQAANSQPLRKPLGSATMAAMAVPMMGPMPGIVANRWLTGSGQDGLGGYLDGLRFDPGTLLGGQNANLDWNLGPSVALRGMFFFFSNGIGLAGSILISILLSLLLLYACSH